MSEKQVRAEFEAWANQNKGGSLLERGPGGTYPNPFAEAAWEAWQASRAALLVDVPDENDDRFWSLLDESTADGNSHIFLEGTFTDAVHEAIEAAGITVKGASKP